MLLSYLNRWRVPSIKYLILRNIIYKTLSERHRSYRMHSFRCNVVYCRLTFSKTVTKHVLCIAHEEFFCESNILHYAIGTFRTCLLCIIFVQFRVPDNECYHNSMTSNPFINYFPPWQLIDSHKRFTNRPSRYLFTDTTILLLSLDKNI